MLFWISVLSYLIIEDELVFEKHIQFIENTNYWSIYAYNDLDKTTAVDNTWFIFCYFIFIYDDLVTCRKKKHGGGVCPIARVEFRWMILEFEKHYV